MKNWSFKHILRKTLCVVLVLSMVLGNVPVFASWNEDETPTGNSYDEAIVTALEEVCGDSYDPIEVLDRLYSVGVIDEQGYPKTTASFVVDGETLSTQELIEEAKSHGENETVTIDGEETTWGKVQSVMQYIETIDILQEIYNSDETMTQEHAENLYSLLSLFSSGNDLQVEDTAGILLGATNPTYPKSWPVNVSESAIDYSWFASGDSNGSGISQSSVVTVKLNKTTVNANEQITATVNLGVAQPVDVTMKYRVVAGSWASASASGNGTLTWKAGESGNKTFTIYVGNSADQGTNGIESFVVQIYEIKNALCDGLDNWQQIISVNRSHSYIYSKTLTGLNLGGQTGNDSKCYLSEGDSKDKGSNGGKTSSDWTISGIPDGYWKWSYTISMDASISGEVSLGPSGSGDGFTQKESERYVGSDYYTKGYAKAWTEYGGNGSDTATATVELVEGNKDDNYTSNPGSDVLWFGYHQKTLTRTSNASSTRYGYAGQINGQTIKVWVETKKAEKNQTKGITYDGEKAHQCPLVYVRVDLTATEATNNTNVASVSIPDGDFYPGQVIPITVKTEFPLRINGNLKLSVNGVDLTAYETNSQSKNFTFYYTVKELDTGTINVTGLSAKVTGANDVSNFTLNNADKAGILAGTNTNCRLITPAKTSSFTSSKIVIDDAMPCTQTIAIDLPISDFSEKGNFPYISWISANTQMLPSPMKMKDADGNEVTVAGYVKSMYASYDGGKTRYPLYVVIKDQEVTIYKPDGSSYKTNEFPVKLVSNICPLMNTTTTKRRDTVEIFMDPEIASVYDYVTTGCTEAVDDNGYTYYIKGSTTLDAPNLIGKSAQLYVKNGIFLKEDYTYTTEGGVTAHWNDVTVTAGTDLQKLLDASTTKQAIEIDEETQIERKVVEIYAQDETVYNLHYEVNNRPDGSFGKDDFTFTAQKYMNWHSSNPEIAEIDENGYITFTGTAGQVYFWLDVTNGGVRDFSYCMYSDIIEVKAGLTPYIQIPSLSRTKLMLENEEAYLSYSSNVTDRNKAEKGDDFATEFTLNLYDYKDVDINGKVATPKAGAKAVYTTTKSSPAEYTDVSGETSIQNVSSLPIAEGVLKKTGNVLYDYVAIVSVTAEATGETLTAYANIKVQTAPAKVKLNKLDNYYVTDDAIPDIKYTVYNVEKDSDIYYVVQQSGGTSKASEITHNATGTVDKSYFTAEAGKLKTVYTVTVYARRYAEDTWSADSMTITVYNHEALQIVVTQVARGELGGYTGGQEASSKNINEDGSIVMDNTSYVEERLTGSGNQIIIDGTQITLDDLQNDINLQAVVSINYGDYVWGMLSDQIKWSSSDHTVASLDYYQGGFYSDIESYTYPSYLPATDFLLVGHKDGKTTLTAKHAINGMNDTVEVTVKTLKDKLYLFQFMPEVKVQVNYTNGDGKATILYSNDNGQLAVYEPSGIVGDISVVSVDREYSASMTADDLYTSEQNIAALQLYPVNNVKLHNISSAWICVQDASGKPVANQTVTVRAGVFRDREYCPNALFRIANDNYTQAYNGRADIVMKTDSNGMLKFKLDPQQFYVNDIKEAEEYTNDISYVFELDYGDNYYPEIVKLSTYATLIDNTSAPTTSTTRRARVGAKAPFIEGIEEMQYSGKEGAWVENSYTIDLIDVTDPIGPNAFFKQVALDTTAMLWGYESVQESEGSYASLPTSIGEGSTIVLKNTNDNSIPEGQKTDVIKTEAVTNLNDIYGLNDVSFYVYPFSSIPLARNGYIMNAETFGATGETVQYTDELGEVYDVKEYTYLPFIEEMGLELNLRLNGKSSIREKLQFTAVNLIDQQYVDADEGALTELIKMTDDNLSKNMDLAGVLDNMDMSEFLKLPFKFIAKISLKLTGGKMNTNIFPTSNPSKFYLLMTPADLQLPWAESNAKITYNQNTKLNNATSVLDEMDISGPGGESFDMGFSGYMLLEASYRLDGWHIRTISGAVKACTGELGKTFKFNLFVGPIPVNFCIGIGGGVKFDFSYMDRTSGMMKSAMDQMIDITLRLYVYLFGGIGVDTSIARLKVGVYGKIGVNIELAKLVSARNNGTYHGQKVSIDGEVGITFIVGVLLVTYEKVLASTKFEIAAWTYNDYDKMMKYWRSGNLKDLDSSYQVFLLQSYEGEDVTLTTYPDGTLMLELDRQTTQDRDYLQSAEREWLNEKPMLFAKLAQFFAPEDNYASKLQTNSYPYTNPVYTDDGEYMLYLSDADISSEAISAVAWADITNRKNVKDKGTFNTYQTVFSTGTAFTKKDVVDGDVYTLEESTDVTVLSYDSKDHSAEFKFAGDKTVYVARNLRNENTNKVKTYIVNADGSRELAGNNIIDSLNASGTNGKYFATWATHVEEVTKEMGSAVNNDDLAMTMQTSEVVVARYDGSKWVEQQLTSDMVGDFAPAIASWDDKAIVVWQRSVSSGTNPLDMNVSNELYFSMWDGTSWSEPESVCYIDGTIKSFDTAILEDGTAIVSYIMETGDDAEGTTDAEACYSVINADGSMKTRFARLTTDSRTDSNVDVLAVVRNGNQQFLMSWLTQIDRDGNSETSADIYNDLSVAVIDKDGNKDPMFIDSIQANESNSVSNPYMLVGSADKDFEDVAVVWAETVPQQEQEDGTFSESYDRMRFVKFYEIDNAQGVTVPVEVTKMDEGIVIDHFDAFIQSSGQLEAVILGSDYNQVASTKISYVDLSPVLTLTGEQESVIRITNTNPVRNLYTAYASVDGAAFTAEEAYFNFSDVQCGFNLPVMIAVTNTGNEKLTKAVVNIGGQGNKEYTINLLPGKTYNLVYQYKVPTENVKDVYYTVTLYNENKKAASNSDGSNTGELFINRPDIGIKDTIVARETNATRDIDVKLNNSGNVPLEGSGKTVKLAFYKDSDMTLQIGTTVVIPSSDYASIDMGVYRYQQTMSLEDMTTLVKDEITGVDEIPAEGFDIYVYAWIENSDGSVLNEVRQANNTGYVTVNSPLARYRKDALTEQDDIILKKISLVNNSSVNVILQNISLGERSAEKYNRIGNIRATALNTSGEEIGVFNTFNFSSPSTNDYIAVGKEATLELSRDLEMYSGQNADDIDSWDIEVFNERNTVFYTWDNEVTGDKVEIPAGTFTSTESKKIGDYEYAGHYVNYGFKSTLTVTPTKGERKFVGWYQVLGYYDGTEEHIVGENGFTAEDLAKIDFIANPTYSRILAEEAYDFEDTVVEKDIVLFALFTSIYVVDSDNGYIPLSEKIEIAGYTDDDLADGLYTLTLELVGDTFSDALVEGVVLNTNIPGIQAKVVRKLGKNIRNNDIVLVQLIGSVTEGYEGQLVIDPGMDGAKYFTLNVPVKSVATANLTVNIKAFFQVHHVLDGVEKETEVGYLSIGESLNPDDYKKNYTGYTYVNGTQGVTVNKDKSSEITLNYTANNYTILYNKGLTAIDPVSGSTIGEITGSTQSTNATYDKEVQLATSDFSYKGYKFNGWNTKEDGSGITYAEGSSVKNLADKGTVTLYAQWVEVGNRSYKVEYYFQKIENGKSSYVLDPEKTVTYTGVTYGAIVKAEAKSFEGYEFSADNSLNVVSAVIPPAYDDSTVTLKLYYDLEKVDVNFYVPGAVGGFTARYAIGSVITVPDNNTVNYPGYKLVSWNTAADGSGATIALTTKGYIEDANGDYVYNNYTDSYVLETGSHSNKKHYSYGDVPNTITVEGPASYYAKFEEISYRVTFKATTQRGEVVTFEENSELSGSGNVRYYDAKYGEVVVFPSVTKTLNGEEQHFIGWYDSLDPQTANEAFILVPANDVTYYAVWGTEYTVNHYFQDIASTGSRIKDAVWDENLTDTVLMWGTAGQATQAVAMDVPGFRALYFEQKTIEEGTVVEIYYLRNSYSVSFGLNGGVVADPYKDSSFQRLPYGASIVEPTLVRDGYIFAGWGAEVPDTVPAYDLEYTAQWVQKPYIIKGTISNLKDGAELVVELRKGADVISSKSYTVSGTSQAYEFSPLVSGIYQIDVYQSVGDDICLMTEGVAANQLIAEDESEKIVIADITMPELNQNAAVLISDGVPAMAVSGLADILAGNVNKGANTTVVFTVSKANNAEELQAINEFAGRNGKYLIMSFDANLEKYTDLLDENKNVVANTQSLITDTDGKYIEMAIPVDYEDVVVYRVHNGVAETVGSELSRRYVNETVPHEGWYYDSVNKVLYVYIDSFCTFALAVPTVVQPLNLLFSVENTNGDVNISRIKNGEITLNVVPDDGYVLKKLSVVKEDGTESEVTKLDNSTYKFVLGDDNVVVKAEFVIRFTDVPENSYYAPAVVWAYSQKITTGVNDAQTLFAPTSGATRSQMVTFLWRAAGCPEPTAKSSGFTDVASGSYYEKAVIWASENGITKGSSETSFNPNGTVTRAEAVTFLARYQGVGDDAVGFSHHFADVKDTDYFNNAVAWAASNGITKGTTETTFAPEDKCQRSQIVTFLYRLFK